MSELTVPLSSNEKILILLKLENDENAVEIGARVLRVDKRQAAVQFSNIDDDKRAQLVKFFARKQKARLPG